MSDKKARSEKARGLASGSEPFMQEDEIVFSTTVLPDRIGPIGFRGEAAQGKLIGPSKTPKRFEPEAGLFGDNEGVGTSKSGDS